MKIGLALSGGGARGIAHLGTLKALDEFGIKPTIISGVSSGAIIATLYSAGIDPDTILEALIRARLYRYVRPAWSKFGFLDMERFTRLYERYLPVKNFHQLDIKLYISATDLQEGKTRYFSEGEILTPLLASSCMPILFVPLSIGNKKYVDGGILNNLPVEPLLGHTDFILGVHCNPTNKSFEMNGIKSMIERTFHLSLALNVKERIKYCDIFIEPPQLANFSIFDLANAKAIFQIGYEHSMLTLAKAEDFMKKHNISLSKV